MGLVFDHYHEPLSQFLAGGFGFDSEGQRLHFRGIRQAADLEDLVADTFGRAFEEPARRAYQALAPYGAYLRAIARNLVLEKLRSRTQRWHLLGSAVSPEESAAAEQPAEGALGGGGTLGLSPEERYQHAELERLLSEFRSGLDGAERRFLALRYDEGLSQAELAERLGQSRRWVRTTETDLRRRLLDHLRGTGYLPAEKGR